MIEFGQEICGNLDVALPREWLETNGMGGFAASTIVGLNTRRYHGLLVAATQPPVGRMVLLSKLEETLVLLDGAGAEHRYELSANQYPGVVHPQGQRHLKQFRLDPFPVFNYEVEGIAIEKAVFMVQGENTVCVQYKVTAHQDTLGSASLKIRPLIAFRDFHATTHENGALNAYVDAQPSLAVIQPYTSLPALSLAHNADSIDATGFWYRNFEYGVERERGLEFREDLFSPFMLHFDLAQQQTLSIVASIEREAANVSRVDALRAAEVERRSDLRCNAPSQDKFVTVLCAAADQFIVQRGASAQDKTVIAGYPWFADWGRDTMIALPGLTLATGKFDIAKSILRTFAQHLDQGMLPNRFPDSGEQPEYNTVDATLWMFEATRALAHYTRDDEFVRRHLYEPLLDVIEWHKRGTRYNIHLDTDGLLFAGQPGVQLTWMDAKVGDWVVTPRIGKPVEIQALWFNALRTMGAFALKFGDATRHKDLLQLATQAQHSFNEQFWNESAGCLFDVVGGGGDLHADARDAAIRPNQIFAISLQHSMLPADKAIRVVNVVQQELLTPVGLRSLSPGDPQFKGHYGGDMVRRDGAYHQGTVWAWLMGPFITAYVKVHGGSQGSRDQAKRWLNGFLPHLSEAGLGHVSEVFDGYAPHKPGGCFAQAWSVAELLRAAVEDI